MHTDDFDFELPLERIAQAPLPERDASRLLHVERATGRREHLTFRDLPKLLRAGDVLVLNDSRVIPARLLGKKAGTGGRAELLLVRPTGDVETEAALQAGAGGTVWTCLGQSSKGFRPGAQLDFDAGLTALVLEDRGGGEFRVRFTSALATLEEAIARAGRLPLPPYIERAPNAGDAERYQTVYANKQGSVAAPTAGLHFTPRLFEALAARGVDRVFVTLEVGPGTFLPVRDGDVSKHVMHAERCAVPEATTQRLRRARQEGGRIVAVGTTVVRTLESFADDAQVVRAGAMDTRIFITPGFRFRVVDALLTNFHLPRSTLLMLVSAFVGREAALAAYAEAVREGYRFFSYGDAMFIDGGPP
ncbi:MAG: tRNA preQ1(34) S-adenosylmethionine ribosyltransferase-isomerase QueA [Myxococcales bacterium]|nr:tRNA preQ1(34) S-adenosylmethionine ribosyltransferase-isomerase QueA [Myxococcales bacterium]